MWERGVSPLKDFVKEYGKLAGALAAGAFLLSFLVGLLTRHHIGTVILRAIVMAAIFGGLGVGFRYVLKKYLPELLERAARPADGALKGRESLVSVDGADRETKGGTIDIVLPEENPLGMPSSAGESADAAPFAPAEGVAASHTGAEDVEELESPAGSPREPGEGEGSTAAARGRMGASTTGAGEPELAIEEIGGVQEEHGAAAFAGRSVIVDAEALPDISSIEIAPQRDAKRRRGPAEGTLARLPVAGESPEQALRGALSGEDPATLARAIRTVLKKDEQG
jgi:hypothetical protein